jgi:Tfp pilus assembly protein PilE
MIKMIVRVDMNFFKKDAGFTMIEVAVIVAIIIILVGIAVPSYVRLQQRTKFSEARTNLGIIKAAEEGYRAEHDVYYDCAKSPRADAALNNLTSVWTDLGTAGVNAFSDIGYAPQEPVRFNYEVVSASGVAFTANANCDLDDDGQIRTYSLNQTSGMASPSGDDM